MAEQTPLQIIARNTLVLGAIVTAGSAFFGGWQVVLGSAAGVGLALGNLFALRRLVTQLLEGERKGIAGGFLLVKFSSLFAILYVLISFASLNPLALTAGFSSLVLAISFGGGVLSAAYNDAVEAE